MIITLLFCVDVKWQISHQSSLFFKLFHGIDRRHQIHLKTLWCDSWDIDIKVYLAVSRHYPAQPFCLVLVLAFALGNFFVARICAWHHFLGVWLYSNYTIGHQILKEYCAWFCQATWLNLFLLPLSCVVNLISESASQGEGCCIEVRDWFLSWGSTAALNCFLTQKNVSRMTRGRSRKRHQSSSKRTDENDHSHTGQGEEMIFLQHNTQIPEKKTRRFYRNESKRHMSW